MERMFKLEVRRQVVGYTTTYYTVEADSFNEAVYKFHDGEADYYDEDSFDEEEEHDRDVDSVECMECGCSESYCSCSEDDDEDDDDEDDDGTPYDRNKNPAPGSATRTTDLKVGDLIEPADAWTKENWFLTTGGCIITDIGEKDGDTRIIRFTTPAGSQDYWYAVDDARFNILTDEEAEEKKAEVLRKKKEQEDRRATKRALHDLLAPTGGW